MQNSKYYSGSDDISVSLRKGDNYVQHDNKHLINYNTDGVILTKVPCDKQPAQVLHAGSKYINKTVSAKNIKIDTGILDQAVQESKIPPNIGKPIPEKLTVV